MIPDHFPLLHLYFPLNPTHREQREWITLASQWVTQPLASLYSRPINFPCRRTHEVQMQLLVIHKSSPIANARTGQGTVSPDTKFHKLSAANRINSKPCACIPGPRPQLQRTFQPLSLSPFHAQCKQPTHISTLPYSCVLPACSSSKPPSHCIPFTGPSDSASEGTGPTALR